MDYSKQANQRKRVEKTLNFQRLASKTWLCVLRVISIVAVAAIFVLGGLLLGGFMGIIDSSPVKDEYDISDFTSYLYDSNGNQLSAIYTSVMRSEVAIEEISPNLQHAVISIEDSRFYDHNGIDIEGILRSGVNVIKGSVEGGSTITQQVIKNIALTSEQAMTRKIQEWYMALKYEYELTQKFGRDEAKSRILETYLNYVNFGNGQYGAQSASRFYFKKDARELSIAESAVLAGVLNAPSMYDPVTEAASSRKRQLLVLDAMKAQGFITEDQYTAARSEDVFSEILENTQDTSEEEETNLSDYTYFEESAMKQVTDDLERLLGYSGEKAEHMVYHGGLQIYLTQDPEMQRIVDEAVDGIKSRYTFYYQLNYALSVFTEDMSDYENYGLYNLLFYSEEDCLGAVESYRATVLADYGLTAEDSKRYNESIDIKFEPEHSQIISDYHNGFIKAMTTGNDEKTVNMAFNRATDSLRQPGSTFKVISAFAPAIDGAGRTAATSYDDVPLNPKLYEGYSPKNWWQTIRWFGFEPIRYGIAQSMNLIAVRCFLDIGPDLAYEYASERFGISTLVPEDKAATMALGGLVEGVSNYELTAAYSAIANRGTYIKPTFYSRVLDHDGNVLLDKSEGGANVESHQALEPDNAWIVENMMQSTVTLYTGYQTASAYVLPNGIPTAAKTGTTDDGSDYWIVTISPYYISTIWNGFDMLTYSGNYGSIEMDSTGSKNLDYRWELFDATMGVIHQDLEYKGFDPVPEDVYNVRVCRKSGKLATASCGSYAYNEYFTSETIPNEYCGCHASAVVCSVTGLLAGDYCPATTKYGVIRDQDLFQLYDILNNDEQFKKLGFKLSLVEDYIPWTYCSGDHSGFVTNSDAPGNSSTSTDSSGESSSESVSEEMPSEGEGSFDEGGGEEAQPGG